MDVGRDGRMVREDGEGARSVAVLARAVDGSSRKASANGSR
jgi:hypothetical protein